MSISDGINDEEDEKADAKDDGDSMKLNKKDMNLFGFCPSRDEFMLAKCEICNMLIKPQALKRHIETRHGPVIPVSLSEPAASSKVLNSELAKTLSLPVTSFGKTSTTNRQPTKASLKHGPCSLRMPGNAASSSGSGNTNCKINAPSSKVFRKTNTNPVVKMERIPKEVASLKKVTTAAVSSCSPLLTDVISSSPVTTTTTHAVRSTVNSPGVREKILTNGAMLKQALGTSRPVTAISTVSVTTIATQPLAMTTTTTSITYTQPATATIPTTTATTSFAVLSRSNKPVPAAALSSALAATLTASSNPLRTSTHSTTGSSKSKKSPKERKFLPCKDREFDANKHCGVKTEETGKPCTRSLTCKTHALGLRRAVPGRKKSFDDLLKEHKAAKEAQQKAKAEEHAAASVGVTLATNSGSSSAPTLVTAVTSPAALAAVSAFKLGPPEISVKSGASSFLSQSSLARSSKAQRPAFSAVFQKLTPGGSFPASLTIKEESSPISEPSGRVSLSSENRLSQSSDRDGENVQEKPDVTYLGHHPRPAAMCTFGARMIGAGYSFSRKTDYVREAFHSALERQLNPPPHKKLCVESKLPKEPQMSSNSKDPYEFNMVDSGLAHQRQTVSFTIGGPVSANSGLLGKPLLKHKAKSLSSHSLNVSGLAVSCGATPTTIAIPTLAAALLKPTKGPDTTQGNSGTGLQRGTLSLTQPLSGQSVKRKRVGSQGNSTTAQSVTPNMIQLQGGGVGLTVATSANLSATGTDGNRVSQQQSAVLTPVSSVNSHCASTPLTAITIPSFNLANAATLGLSATLPGNKQHGQGQKSNIVKDFNLVLTGIDSSLVNGQYLNITGTQLAELAAAQAVNATAEDKNIKRSRLTTTKGAKISGTLETLRALQGNNVITAVPQNAVLVDRQGAVLAPVSSLSGGSGSGGNSTFVTFTTNTVTSSQTGSSITVAPNTIFRTVSESGTQQQVTFTTPSLANGIIPSSGDKLHVATGSTLSRIANNIQGQSSSTATAKTLQASGLLQAQGTPICPTTGLTQLAHFKSGAYITKGGKITMQPMSVTIPLVNTVGLSALPTSQQQTPQTHSHSQPTLLVTTTADEGRAGSGVTGSGKTEIHIQPHISSASSGVIS